jgi:hypothetical protein
MSSRDDVDRVLAVVSDLKQTTKKLEALHEFDVKMAIEFFERSPPLAPPLEPPSDERTAKPLSSDNKLSILR